LQREILQGSLHKRLQTCIDNGCAVFGKVTAKKPMPGLPSAGNEFLRDAILIYTGMKEE